MLRHIVLGGRRHARYQHAGRDSPHEAAERLTETAALAFRFPNAKIVISGGDGALLYASMGEAGVAKRFFTRLGIAPERILLEEKSRTTSENAVFTKALVTPQPGERWLLVTSAFHMPRAMGCSAPRFRPHAWTVDFAQWSHRLLRFSPRPSRPGGASTGVQGMDCGC